MQRQQKSQSSQNSQAAGCKDDHEGSVLDNLKIPISTQLQPSTAQSSSLKVDVCPPSDSCPQAAVPGTPNILLNNADPSQLQSYPPMVHDIIKCAKQFIRKMGRCWHDQSDITNRYQHDVNK